MLELHNVISKRLYVSQLHCYIAYDALTSLAKIASLAAVRQNRLSAHCRPRPREIVNRVTVKHLTVRWPLLLITHLSNLHLHAT